MSAVPQSINPRKPWLGMLGASAMAIAAVFTQHNEGLEYQSYPDTGGTWTICNGHTSGVVEGDTATPVQCHAYLVQDMKNAAQAVSRCIRVPLTVNQAAALYDTVFNVGPSVVCGSTLQRLANAGNLVGMCAQLPRWNHSDGYVLKGLTNRRVNAMELCNYPNQGQSLVYPANWKGAQ